MADHVEGELGREWMEPNMFRFGASGLLTDIERQLEHHVTGRYSAAQTAYCLKSIFDKDKGNREYFFLKTE